MPEPLWTSGEIVQATDGLLQGRGFAVSGVSIDTRTLQRGDLFVALRDERDGHAFARAAFEKGAEGALTAQPVDGPHIEVRDTLLALGQLGVAARKRCPAKRGAVTGSVGKTSVTQAIKAGLELAGPAHGSVQSYNNHIGVPLTLARMPRDTGRAVFEIGMNHAGEIEPLSKMVQPHAVAITKVGPVHTENFADGEAGVARAKAEIFAGLTPGGAAVLNADDPWFGLLRDEAARVGARVVTFGSVDESDAQLQDIQPRVGGTILKTRLHGRSVDVPIAQTGAHWGLNCLCVLLMLEALDVDLDTGLRALAGFGPLEGRGAERTIAGARGDFVLVDESYNANPVSMRAAIAALGSRPATGRRIAVLTDMLELGNDAPRLHADLAEPLVAANVDLVFCAGPMMQRLWDALPAGRRGGYAPTAEALAPEVVTAVGSGDVVMVKGSKGSKASAIAAALGQRTLTDAGGAV